MMDPFSALAIATSTIQFLEFGTSIVTGTIERYRSSSGLSTTHAELEDLTTRLKDLIEPLGASPDVNRPLPNNDEPVYTQKLRNVVQKSQTVATELLKVLEDVKVHSKGKFAGSLMATLKSCGKDRSIKKLQGELDSLQKELQFCMMLIAGVKQASSTDSLGNIDRSLERLQGYQEGSLAQQEKILGEISKQRDSATPADWLATFLESMKTAQSRLRILDSLRYPMMRMRESNIADAQFQTFDWIMRPSTATYARNTHFHEWLSSEGGIYWITGKPGSGKSTLMKFLYTHPSTREALEKWAEDSHLTISGHFFWTGGPDIQRSMDGLLLSLLEKILVDLPHLMPEVCRQRWEDPLLQNRQWTRAELLDCFKRLSSPSGLRSTKFCFFIDALDEYDGVREEAIDIFQDLCKSPNIKICISSRDYPFRKKNQIWRRSTAERRILRLQDHTSNDIRRYVRVRLERTGRNGLVEELDGTTKNRATEDLIDDISSMANGVFLWVSLVCDELVKGIANKDSVALLRRRLCSLPTNLETYFLDMLRRLDRNYRKECAQILLVMVASRKPVDLLTFQFLDFESGPPFSRSQQTLTFTKTLEIQDRLAVQLRAYTADMVEVVSLGEGLDPDDVPTRHAVFVHSTVPSFLETATAQTILREYVGLGFNVRRTLCGASLFRMEQLPCLFGPPFDQLKYSRQIATSFHKHLNEFMYHMSCYEAETSTADETLMNRLDEMFAAQSPEAHHLWLRCLEAPSCKIPFTDAYPPGSVIALAAQRGLCRYVSRRLDQSPLLVHGHDQMYPLLRYALCPAQKQHLEERVLSADMVRLLVNRSGSPNQRYLGTSPWSEFLQAITDPNAPHRWNPNVSLKDTGELAVILEILLRSGACASSQLEIRKSGHDGIQLRLAHVRQIQEALPQNNGMLLAATHWTPWWTAAAKLRSIRIMAWLSYTLVIRFLRDALGPHGMLDLATISMCLAPNAVLITCLAGWDMGPALLGPSFRLALAVAFSRCLLDNFQGTHAARWRAQHFRRAAIWTALVLGIRINPPIAQPRLVREPRAETNDHLAGDSQDIFTALSRFTYDSLNIFSSLRSMSTLWKWVVGSIMLAVLGWLVLLLGFGNLAA